MKYVPPILTTFRNNTTKIVLDSFMQHIYPHELCIPSYICGWFPAKRSMKCKESREINWGNRPSPFSPWFRHKAAGSVLISDLESSPVNKSDNWGRCQTNWIVAVRLRPCSERNSLTIIWRLLIADESRQRSIYFTFKINHCLKTTLNISSKWTLMCGVLFRDRWCDCRNVLW